MTPPNPTPADLIRRLRDKSNEWDAGGKPLYICEEAADTIESMLVAMQMRSSVAAVKLLNTDFAQPKSTDHMADLVTRLADLSTMLCALGYPHMADTSRAAADTIAALQAENERLKAEQDAPLHASAPVGYKCSDCSIDSEACPTCYRAWWTKRHPNVEFVNVTRQEAQGHG